MALNSWGALQQQFDAAGTGPAPINTTPTYAANGMMGTFQVPNYQNPYTDLIGQAQGMIGQDSNLAMSGINRAQGNISQLAMQGNNYPTYPNGAGVGNQMVGVSAGSAPQVPGTGFGTNSNSTPNETSHGFNPWSLTGEALSRVK